MHSMEQRKNAVGAVEDRKDENERRPASNHATWGGIKNKTAAVGPFQRKMGDFQEKGERDLIGNSNGHRLQPGPMWEGEAELMRIRSIAKSGTPNGFDKDEMNRL